LMQRIGMGAWPVLWGCRGRRPVAPASLLVCTLAPWQSGSVGQLGLELPGGMQLPVELAADLEHATALSKSAEVDGVKPDLINQVRDHLLGLGIIAGNWDGDPSRIA